MMSKVYTISYGVGNQELSEVVRNLEVVLDVIP